MNNHQERFLKAQRITLIGIIGNLFLVVLKGIIGWLAHSQALIADAFHTFSDLFATFIVFLSLKVAKKPEDDTHPYGHGKIESIASGFVGVLLVGGGLLIMAGAIKSVISGGLIKPATVALYIAAFSIIFKEVMYRATISVGKELDSPAVIASAMDHRSDAYSSIGVFFGILGAIIGFPVLDPLAGGAVSIFIMRIGYHIIRDSWHQLMDRTIDSETIKKIETLTESVQGVEHIHEIKARQMGQYIVVDLKIEVDSDITIASGHSIAGRVKYTIMEKIPNISDVMVHINPHVAHS